MIEYTVGLPKRSNSHGNRVAVVLENCFNGQTLWVRATVFPRFDIRSYSTGCTTDHESNIVKKLEGLFLRSKINPTASVDRNLYKLMCDRDLLLIAYNKLKSKPGQITPGISSETLDGMSGKTIDELIEQLKDESFQFQPGRRVMIPKPSGGERPLTVAPPRDKLIQEAMRMILEAVYEPTFSDHSHGFRPNRGCHSALLSVSQKFNVAT